MSKRRRPLTSTERKRLWRLRHPIESKAAEAARSRRRCREFGGSYWDYEHNLGRWNSRSRQTIKGLRARITAYDDELGSLFDTLPKPVADRLKGLL